MRRFLPQRPPRFVQPQEQPVEPAQRERRLPQRTPPVPRNTEESDAAKMVSDRAFVESQLSGMHNLHESSLINDLLPYKESANFGGNIIRGEDGAPQKILDFLPQYVVPMFAPFENPYAADWMLAFKGALEFIRSRCHLGNSEPDDDETYLIVIPINSPGGDTRLLKEMIHLIDTAKSELTSDGKRRIRIVTHGSGIVASCAFILYQMGDICIAGENTGFLCHEPMQMSGGTVTTAEDAEKIAVELHALKEKIYFACELCMLGRYKRRILSETQGNQGRGREGVTVEECRRRWLADHEEVLHEFMLMCQPLQQFGASLPAFDVQNTTIFHYVTELVANDPHHKFIDAVWMWKLSLVEAVGMDIHMHRSEFISLAPNIAFQRRLLHII